MDVEIEDFKQYCKCRENLFPILQSATQLKTNDLLVCGKISDIRQLWGSITITIMYNLCNGILNYSLRLTFLKKIASPMFIISTQWASNLKRKRK